MLRSACDYLQTQACRPPFAIQVSDARQHWLELVTTSNPHEFFDVVALDVKGDEDFVLPPLTFTITDAGGTVATITYAGEPQPN
jgi:hypothetical protein